LKKKNIFNWSKKTGIRTILIRNSRAKFLWSIF